MRNSISFLLLAVIITHTYSIYVEKSNAKIVGKETIYTRYKPRRHHYRRAVVDEDKDNVIGSAVLNTEPQTKKRISIGESSPDAREGFNSSASNNAYETKVTYRPGPDFYADIFRIPISVLQAVSNFLGNNIAYINGTTVQGTTPIQTETKPKPPVIGSLSLLTPSLPSASSSPPQSASSSPPEASDMFNALSEAEDLPSSELDVPESPSISSDIGGTKRQ